MKKRFSVFCVSLVLAGAAVGAPPDFREVYGLVRSNLMGVDQVQLDQAAVNGLVNQFPGRVMLVEGNGSSDTAKVSDPLAESLVFDGGFLYFRVTEVSPELRDELRRSWVAISGTNKGKIKGVVLDLRFAGGTDYAAAGAAADCFLGVSQPLLEWPGGKSAATNKDDAITVPVALLVNTKTAGAAEALAAVMRASDRALTVGTKTAGEASVFKEFPLATGQKVRIAVAEVKLAGGPALTGGLTADIPVRTTLEEDKAYLTNPYKSARPEDIAASDSQTNEPTARFNEAELVKEHREGVAPGEGLIGTTAAPSAPVIADPSLARALDVLKGLAVINGGKPG